MRLFVLILCFFLLFIYLSVPKAFSHIKHTCVIKCKQNMWNYLLIWLMQYFSWQRINQMSPFVFKAYCSNRDTKMLFPIDNSFFLFLWKMCWFLLRRKSKSYQDVVYLFHRISVWLALKTPSSQNYIQNKKWKQQPK